MNGGKKKLNLRPVIRIFALGLWVPAALGCGTTSPAGAARFTGDVGALSPTPIADPPSRLGLPTLFVAMPNAPDFVAVRNGLVSEVYKNFNVTTFVVTTDTKEADLGAALDKVKPACAVLMNNATLNLYRKYEDAHVGAKPIPTVVVMASFLDEVLSKLKHATGISYEVPGVTAFVNLRSIVKSPVARVGVVYRPVFQKFIERQKTLAAREAVELVPVPIAPDISAANLRDTLTKMVKVSKVDALWMLNDNALLRDGSFLNDAWRAALTEANVPLIVGVPNLVDPSSPLGTLAVVPDHEALGFQAANLILDLFENDWDLTGHPVELPLSVKTVVDLKSARANFGLRDDALRHIDKPLE